jgi:hypothetical protein
MQSTDQAARYKMNTRSLAALFMFFSFILLVPSGIAMHLAAQSSAGQWHHATMAAHVAAALIFLVSAAIHLAVNWHAIMRYLLSKTKMALPLKREAVVAACLTILFVLLVGSHTFHLH